MNQNNSDKSAYDLAGDKGIDPRCIPIQLENPAPIGKQIAYPNYSEEEHDIWKILYQRQVELLHDCAAPEFLDGLNYMNFPTDRIPYLGDVSLILNQLTNWQTARVPGLLHEADFFKYLSERIFPSTDYIRTRKELDYTPAPDLFHDIFGHTPMITLKEFADFYQQIGTAAGNASGEKRRQLERIYWFTVEFGLINSPNGLKIYGNGILSSYSEVHHSLSDKVKKKHFNCDLIAQQDYDVWHEQDLLFVIDSFEELENGFSAWATQNGLIK